MIDVTGKTAMVSGGSRGLGAAFARRLLGEGWNVSVGARQPEQAQAAVGTAASPTNFVAHRYDAVDPATTESWIQATLDRFGSIDALINNAGIIDTSPLDDLTEDSLDEMWRVNVVGPFRMIKAALPHLRATGSGRVINVSSLSGLRVRGQFGPGYAMSKFAVTALTEAVKNAGFDDGVRVTSLHPGYVKTDMTADFDYPDDDMIQADDLAELVATVLRLPNSAQVARLTVSCELEPGL